jgi:hypothetical protein
MAIGMKTVWILHRPEIEKNDFVRVLNHKAPKPHLTLAHIGELQPKQIENLGFPLEAGQNLTGLQDLSGLVFNGVSA